LKSKPSSSAGESATGKTTPSSRRTLRAEVDNFVVEKDDVVVGTEF
jgi:hypothetical protein